MKKATAALLGILLLAGCSDGGGGIFSGWGASCEMTHFQPVENTGQLLKQLYDYPKSCMPELEAKHDELEKIWGITVYSASPLRRNLNNLETAPNVKTGWTESLCMWKISTK